MDTDQSTLCPKRINSLLRECVLAKIPYNLPLFCSEYMHLIRVNAKEISLMLCEKKTNKPLAAVCGPGVLQLVTERQCSIPGDRSRRSCKTPAGITTTVKLILHKAERK